MDLSGVVLGPHSLGAHFIRVQHGEGIGARPAATAQVSGLASRPASRVVSHLSLAAPPGRDRMSHEHWGGCDPGGDRRGGDRAGPERQGMGKRFSLAHSGSGSWHLRAPPGGDGSPTGARLRLRRDLRERRRPSETPSPSEYNDDRYGQGRERTGRHREGIGVDQKGDGQQPESCQQQPALPGC